jgi:nucleoid-associated protein YgaU
VSEQIQAMMTEAKNLDTAADRAIVGRTKTTYVAKDGDTWEAMATRFYGGPGRANDIRDANLASPGEQVRPGQEYLIPV